MGYNIVPGMEGMDDVDPETGEIKKISIKIGSADDEDKGSLGKALADETPAINELVNEDEGTKPAEEMPSDDGDKILALVKEAGLGLQQFQDMLKEWGAKAGMDKQPLASKDEGDCPKSEGKATPTEIPADKKPSDGPSTDDIPKSGKA